MSCSCGPMCPHTNSVTDVLQLRGGCNLVVEAQWGVVTLVLLVFLVFVVIIETIVIISYGCYLCYLRRRRTNRYELVKKSAKSKLF